MKRKNIFTVLFAAGVILFAGCKDYLDTGIDNQTTPETLATNPGSLWSFANAFYYPMNVDGLYAIDNNLFAAASDEAQATSATSSVSYFNNGTINANMNPLSNRYKEYYEGIRAAHYFMDYAKDGENFLALNRDTVGSNRISYERDVRRLKWYRAESHVARAYYYMQLTKMYGGVPIVETTMDKDPNMGRLVRSSYDDVVNHIVELIDGQLNNVNQDWMVPESDGNIVAGSSGRFDRAAAMAIKARTLLYAASPRNNPNNDVAKWERAARAAHDLIVFKRDVKGFVMPTNRDYGAYFRGTGSLNNGESILLWRGDPNNVVERNNYPIGTAGGGGGSIAPSHNLVSAYEYIGTPDPANMYTNRDPRLAASIVVNGSIWNNRTIDQSSGGSDDMAVANSSRTGYYLKKFLTDNLNLVEGGTAQHLWPIFRYSEVLLNYAEAMNEAYGPDEKPSGFTLSAREALKMVRDAASTDLPAVTDTDKAAFRAKVKHERRIELAFEDHRYWDLVRWKDAATVLNQPVRGVRVSKNGDAFSYQVADVASRTFQERNYYWPFSRAEITNSNGALIQNDGY